jgi:hypothetical protein
MNTGDLVTVKVPGNIFFRCLVNKMQGPKFSCYVTGDSADGITFRNVMWSYNRFNVGTVISS